MTWCGGVIGACVSILAAGLWLDKPTAYLANALFGHYQFIGSFTESPSFFGPLATIVFFVFLGRRVCFYSFGRADEALLLSDFSIVLTKFTVPWLKFVFGRAWPSYHHHSLISDGTFGFSFFSNDPAFQSFPSGHTASVCALVFIFWAYYPRFWPFYLLSVTTIGGSLIAGNYHYVSDVLAGGVVGATAATIVIAARELVAASNLEARLASLVSLLWRGARHLS
jgi:membrane-associated phospholipid phosphatase